MKKAFLVSSNSTISKWLLVQFNIETTESYNDADLVVFPGGLDVDPSLYQEPMGQRTSANKDTDGNWASMYRQAVADGKKLLGICKGSQFLTVMSGGRLYQHVTGHGLSGLHSVAIKKDKYMVTSTHHQMMNPYELDKDDYEVLAYSDEKRSSCYLNGYDDEEPVPEQELEAVFYKGNGALAIQFHPEFMDSDDPIHKVIKGWLHKISEYKLKAYFDRYKSKKVAAKKGTSKGSKDSYSELTEATLDEFMEHYLK